MKVIIDIPEERYKDIQRIAEVQIGLARFQTAEQIIANGTPLPKGHGRIKDIDKIEWYGCTTESDCPHKDRECKDCNRAECSKTQVDAIPTIIEADKAENKEYEVKVINRGNCVLCGKKLTEGLFFCKDCEAKGK